MQSHSSDGSLTILSLRAQTKGYDLYRL